MNASNGISSSSGHRIRECCWTLVTLLLFVFAASRLPGASLVENSPFIPEGFRGGKREEQKVAAKPDQAMRDIELRGIYSLDSEYYFNIFNKSKQKGTWVRLNDPGADYRIVRYDERANRIQINLGGSTEEMYLKKPDSKPLPIKTAATAASAQPNQAQGGRTNVSQSRQTGAPVVRRRVITPNRTRSARAPQRSQNSRSSAQRSSSNNAGGDRGKPTPTSPTSGEDLLRQMGNQ